MKEVLIFFKRILITEIFYFTSLFVLIIWLFRKAFSINFFADDYFFLKISRIKNISGFLNFYSPFHDYSYKPLATETFYFIIHLLNNNIFIGHLIVFLVYFIGLVYLYKIIKLLTKDILLSKLVVFLYGISFIHVFQLYWFATFQEIALFAFLAISFYSFLKKKLTISVGFFILASLCKETAALYLPYLLLFIVLVNKGNLNKIKKNSLFMVIIIILTGFFYLLYRYSLNKVTSLDNYKIIWNLRLLLNNGMWYFLWAMGFPNFMSDYFRSIFSKPLPPFWEILKIPYIKIYFYTLLIYLIGLAVSLIVLIITELKKLKRFLLIISFCLYGFFVFLGPILFFRHKWMIRLTMPLIFISFLQAYFLLQLFKNKYTKHLLGIFLIIFVVWNVNGIITHESSSLYTMENDIYIKSKEYFNKNKIDLYKNTSIVIQDNYLNKNDIYKNSQKLYNSFHDQDFIDHFLPESKIKVIYGFNNKVVPKNSYIIESQQLIP